MCTEVFYKDLKIFKEDDIIIIQPVTDTNLELRDIINIRKIAKDLCNSDKQLILTDVSDQYLGISTRARKFMSKSEDNVDIRMAEAYVTNSLPMKIIINHYVNSNQPRNQVETFDSREEAVEWLRQI